MDSMHIILCFLTLAVSIATLLYAIFGKMNCKSSNVATNISRVRKMRKTTFSPGLQDCLSKNWNNPVACCNSIANKDDCNELIGAGEIACGDCPKCPC